MKKIFLSLILFLLPLGVGATSDVISLCDDIMEDKIMVVTDFESDNFNIDNDLDFALDDLASDNSLKNLYVTGYGLNFNPEVLVYTLKINDEEKLNVGALARSENATIEISGNDNLKNGSVISIKVTSENGLVKTYKINILKENKTLYIILGVLLVLLLGVLIFIVVSKLTRKKEKSLDETLRLNRGINERIVIKR